MTERTIPKGEPGESVCVVLTPILIVMCMALFCGLVAHAAQNPGGSVAQAFAWVRGVLG